MVSGSSPNGGGSGIWLSKSESRASIDLAIGGSSRVVGMRASSPSGEHVGRLPFHGVLHPLFQCFQSQKNLRLTWSSTRPVKHHPGGSDVTPLGRLNERLNAMGHIIRPNSR